MNQLKNMETTHGKVTPDNQEYLRKNETIFNILHAHRKPQRSVAKDEYISSLQNKPLEELQQIGLQKGVFPFSTKASMIDALTKAYQRTEGQRSKDNNFRKTINTPNKPNPEKDAAIRKALARK